MATRIAVAIRVWLAGMVCAGAAFVVGFVIMLLATGAHSPKPVLTYIVLTVLPFIAAAVPATLVSEYVSRASNGAFHAGPMVLGLAAGFVLGAVGIEIGMLAFLVFGGVIGPIIGATLATFVKLPLPPLAAGAISAVLGAIFAYTALNP